MRIGLEEYLNSKKTQFGYMDKNNHKLMPYEEFTAFKGRKPKR